LHERILITTEDGSHSIRVPGLNENYHSTHGAIQESRHVFIEMGWKEIIKENYNHQPLNIFEMGFGTGLNALLTLIESETAGISVSYHGLEAYPLEKELIGQLNYGKLVDNGYWQNEFTALHDAPWNESVRISDHFTLIKENNSLRDFIGNAYYDLVYFDAFAPDVQPELWTADIFRNLYSKMNPGAILVTYSCKGQVKRNLRTAGFEIEKLPGPPGKREMLRARHI
jgi:tRNA U34 5-methylaminomethyl-2-thiouridine-forming methyltransferase MnmC